MLDKTRISQYMYMYILINILVKIQTNHLDTFQNGHIIEDISSYLCELSC